MRKLKSCSLIQNHAQFVWEFDKFGGIYMALDNIFLWKVKDGSRFSGESRLSRQGLLLELSNITALGKLLNTNAHLRAKWVPG